jgi:hypothetical protein
MLADTAYEYKGIIQIKLNSSIILINVYWNSNTRFYGIVWWFIFHVLFFFTPILQTVMMIVTSKLINWNVIWFSYMANNWTVFFYCWTMAECISIEFLRLLSQSSSAFVCRVWVLSHLFPRYFVRWNSRPALRYAGASVSDEQLANHTQQGISTMLRAQ